MSQSNLEQNPGIQIPWSSVLGLHPYPILLVNS